MSKSTLSEEFVPGQTQIKIYGKLYNIKDTPSAIDLQELAAFLDAKMKELAKAKAGLSTMDLAVLAALNIAQELFELKRDKAATQGEIDKKTERLVKVLTKEMKSLESKAVLDSR